MKKSIATMAQRVRTLSCLACCLIMSGCSPLLGAARNGNLPEVRRLLDSGADVNESFHGETALVYASIRGNTELARLLLDRGAAVNASIGYGLTPLVYAVQRGHGDLARLLIERGADVEGARAKLASLGPEGTAGLGLLERLARKQQPGAPAADGTHHVQDDGNRNASPPPSPPSNPIPALAPPDADAVAVIIGIEKYQALPPAGFARNDAALVRDYLRAMGYQDRNIELLSDERATFSGIRKALESWLPNRANGKSRVIVYYAGHGAPDPATGEAYIVPYDGDPGYLPDTGYPLKRLYEKLETLPSRQVVLLIDACFSGAGGRGVLAAGARSLVRVAKAAPTSNRIAVITSTQGTQISTSSPERHHGIFTYYLVKAFGEGKRSVVDVYDYLAPKVEDEAKRMNVEQTPSLSPERSGITGQLAFW